MRHQVDTFRQHVRYEKMGIWRCGCGSQNCLRPVQPIEEELGTKAVKGIAWLSGTSPRMDGERPGSGVWRHPWACGRRRVPCGGRTGRLPGVPGFACPHHVPYPSPALAAFAPLSLPTGLYANDSAVSVPTMATPNLLDKRPFVPAAYDASLACLRA